MTSPLAVTERPIAFLLAALLVLPGAPRRLSQEPGAGSAQPEFTWETSPGLESAAERFLPEVRSILAEAREWTGLPPDTRPFHLQIVGSREDLQEALGHKAPGWFAAVAVPFERRLILATAPAGSVQRLHTTLRHELMHLAMADLGPEDFRRLPAWFHEGCAEVFAGEVYLGGTGASLPWLAWTGALEPLASFRSEFGAERLRAAQGYALGEAFVARLRRVYGPGVIAELLALVDQGATLDGALLDTTNLSVITHEQELRKELSSPLALIGEFYPQLFLGLMLAALAVTPFVLRRRRGRRRELEAKWDREENGDSGLGRVPEGAWKVGAENSREEGADALEGWLDEEY